jgi:hypothetical protein
VNLRIKNAVLPIARMSFALIEKFGLKTVFGFDSDFERFGHTVL